MSGDIEALARGVILTGWSPDAPEYAGCVLFARDGESVAEVRARTDALRARSELTPLIAIDQEGGRVARLRRDVESIPSMMALGAVGDERLAFRSGEAIAHDLKRAGVTIDFAPVLDLAVDSRNTVIGTRAFGSDPELVSRLGLAFARGLRSGGIVPVYKHFPGHGSTDRDSHLELPRVAASAEAFRANDLEPFARLARDAEAVMSAHVVVDAFDPKNPASLSSAIMRHLLRDELGFEGVAFSDCLQMNAVASLGAAEAVVSALAAGTDCAIVSHDLELAEACARRLVDATRRGELPLARLQEAHDRVRRLRQAGAPPSDMRTPAPYPGIGREIACRAVTLVRGSAAARARESVVVSFEGESYDGVGGDRASAVMQAPGLESLRASLNPEGPEVTHILDRLAASGRRPIVLARSAHLHPGQVGAIDAIVQRQDDAIVISTREPFDIPCFERAKHVLATYGDEAVSLDAAAEVLFDGVAASGTLPVHW